MKWMFLVLLLLNIVVFLWLYPTHREPPPAPPLVEQGVPPLVLLEESGRSPFGTQAQGGKGGADGPVATAEPQCYVAGPFTDASLAGEVAARLEEAGAVVQMRREQVNEPAGYRVYLPPMASREAAQAVIRDLEERGLKDYLLVGSKEMRNAISLGVFRDRAFAEKRREQVAAMGYEPVVKSRFKAVARHWLDIRSSGHGFRERLLPRLPEAARRIPWQLRECGPPQAAPVEP